MLGYDQPVEVKHWPAGLTVRDSLPSPRVIPQRREASTYEEVLRVQFDYLEARQMLPKGGRLAARNADSDRSRESVWAAFRRKFTVPYLYGLVKTHKEPRQVNMVCPPMPLGTRTPASNGRSRECRSGCPPEPGTSSERAFSDHSFELSLAPGLCVVGASDSSRR